MTKAQRKQPTPIVGPSPFGERTLAFRKRFGMSRESFGAAVNVSPTTVRGWEKHGREPLPGYRPGVERYMERRASV